MSTYETQLQGREEIAAGTMAFHFAKPQDFSFKPGQAIDVILPDPPDSDAQSARHAFSIVSAPFESNLTIATRMRDSAFKRTLRNLPTGSAIRIEGPFGALTLHNKRARAAVLIAGGIGITPFVSILRQAANDQLSQNLVLLYSNRRPEDSAFLAELQALEQRNKSFRLLATMTEPDHPGKLDQPGNPGQSGQPWTGATGLIDEALLKRIGGELAEPIYYLAGPPAMVEAMRKNLNLAGVDDDDIRSEDFYGY